MSLFFNEHRDKSDIDEIFSYIYTDLTSLHPSNEYLRIFLQYFWPLFDLTLGVAYFNGKIMSANYLSNDAQEALKQKANSLCSNSSSITLCTGELLSTVHNELTPFIEECSSCIYIPILIKGCSDNERKKEKKRSYNSSKGSFMLLSRLKDYQFKADGCPGNNFFDYVLRHVTASFLQQSARKYYLNNSKLEHRCDYKDEKSDTCKMVKGIGPLNKAGVALCK